MPRLFCARSGRPHASRSSAPPSSREKFLEDELKAQAARLGLTDVVEFTGFRSDVPLLIQQLAVLVHASTTGEPFGQVIVQGMAASRPVVATNGGGVPEIVVDGVTGYLVPMSDAQAMAEAISRLLSSPSQAAEMGPKRPGADSGEVHDPEQRANSRECVCLSNE